ncbi:metalloprotease, variant 2 [Entomophthora muscae]|uniref:Metalloprotease, variant 2 n=1 Tax=Entomophthora muscae TaxID=34485 RepID=A0ACC2TD97_9FUNG|nr:metalloprotease, variant 2 [Entomophthora muscae]
MHLVVSSNEEIETLKEMVIPRFSLIPNTNIGPSNIASSFNSSNLPMEVFVDPGNEIKRVDVVFTLAPVPYAHHQESHEFFKYLFLSEEEGSLSDALETKRLINYMTCHVEYQAGVSEFTFTFHTTAKGHEDPYKILYILFSYIHAIKQDGITLERYQDFIARTPQRESVFDLSIKLGYGASFQTLLHDTMPTFDRHNLLTTINQLTPQNFILYVMKNFTGPRIKEPWFGLQYSKSKFNSNFLNSLTPNESRITLPPISNNQIPVPSIHFKPEIRLLESDSIGYVINSNLTKHPSVKLILDFNSNPKLLPCLDLLKALITTIAKLSRPSPKPITAEIEHESLCLYLRDTPESIATHLTSLISDLKSFKVNSLELINPSIHAITHFDDVITDDPIPNRRLDQLMNPHFRDKQQILSEAASISLAQFHAFHAHLFDAPKFDILATGQISDELLLSLKAQLKPLFSQNTFLTHTYLPHRGDYVYIENYTKDQAAILFYLHLYTPGDAISYALAQVTHVLIKARFHHQLRTKERLGYNVGTSIYHQKYVGGLKAIVQGNQPPAYLESRIEAFLTSFVEEIRNQSETNLNQTIASIAKVLHQPITPSTKFSNNWDFLQAYFPSTKTSK